MAVYLSIDGGGSKLAAMLFNEHLELLGTSTAQGVNPSSTSAEDIRRNIARCMAETFANTDHPVLDAVYITIFGQQDALTEAIAPFAEIRDVVRVSELQAGILAGGLWDEGFLALAGTGSNLFLQPGKYMLPEWEGKLLKVGGWGAIMGDDGSGVWMGVKAARQAIAAWEGWGKPTTLFERIMDFWQLKEPYDLKRFVYRQPSPHRQLGQLTSVLGQAAREGDEAALEIIRSAGEAMARQTLCLIKRCKTVPEPLQKLVCTGGAWKVHPLMYETFTTMLAAEIPWLKVHQPVFEPVAAGMLMALENSGMTRQKAAAMIRQKQPGMCISW